MTTKPIASGAVEAVLRQILETLVRAKVHQERIYEISVSQELASNAAVRLDLETHRLAQELIAAHEAAAAALRELAS